MTERDLSLLAIGAPGCLLLGAWTGLSGYSGWPLVVPGFFGVPQVPLLPSLAASMLIDRGSAVGASFGVAGTASAGAAAGVEVWMLGR